jgi:hypothetical protein
MNWKKTICWIKGHKSPPITLIVALEGYQCLRCNQKIVADYNPEIPLIPEKVAKTIMEMAKHTTLDEWWWEKI